MTFRTVYLKTTESCNLSCKHCFTGGSRPPRTFWHEEDLVDWIERFHQYIPPDDQIHFELHGGEPMLAPIKSIKRVAEKVHELRNGKRDVDLGITTNLVYKINDEKLDFLTNWCHGVGTSWDPMIRFKNPYQENTWVKNVNRLIEAREGQVGVMVSVSKALVEMDQKKLLIYLRDLGFRSVMFERITHDGNALGNFSLFPTNKEIQDWYLALHRASEELGARDWFYNSALEDVYAKFEQGNSGCGTFCRDCEERLFTINADGSVAGCPNSAPTSAYGHITQPIDELFKSNGRIAAIVDERQRSEYCYTCPVFQYCASDCHQLSWDGPICPAPKKLMMKLAGIENNLFEKGIAEVSPETGKKKYKTFPIAFMP